MPFVKVYYNKNSTFIESKTISKYIHSSLQVYFNVPVEDIFYLCLPYNEKDFIFDNSYLLSENKNRTTEIVYIDILCGNGRTKEQKQNLYKSIATSISENTEIKKENIFITIKETEIENWSFGEGIAQMII